MLRRVSEFIANTLTPHKSTAPTVQTAKHTSTSTPSSTNQVTATMSSGSNNTVVESTKRRSTRVKGPSLKAREIERSKSAQVTDIMVIAATTPANISKKRKTTASSTEPTKKAKNTSSTMAPVAPTKKARAAPKTSAGKKSAATTKQAAPATKKSAATKTTAASKNTATAKSTASSSKKDTSVKKSTGTKRKAVDDDDQGEDKQPAKKKQTPAPKQTKAKERKVISSAPTERLKIFVFGEGSAGELGLGPRGNIIDVKRPRLNPFLPGDKVGVVQIAPGGMHCAALTHDNRILTWGVNDNGALGRNTKAGELLKSIDADDSDDVDGDRLNPLESTPGAIELDNVPEGTVFTSVAAGDSCTFALTDEGVVYGCGTFRANEGVMGFTLGIDIQRTFMKVPELKNITKIVCGLNHVLALDTMGRVWSWGAGQQCQLGKRVVERTRASLTPREFGMGKGHVYIGVGSYHSFAIHGNGTVKAWGLNSFGQTGCADDLGENEAVVPRPKEVPSLSGKDIVHLTGGAHHTLAVTGDGQCLGWGRLDGCQLGIDGDDLPEESKKRDDRGKVRICTVPTQVPNIDGTVVSASAGPDQCLTVTNKGRAFSWGFSVNYQTGQGTTDDVEEATLIDNTATRGEKLIFAGAGGQFGVLASKYEEAE